MKRTLQLLVIVFIATLLLAQTHTNAVLDVAQVWTAAQTFTGGTFVYNLVQPSGSPHTMLGVSGYYWNNTASTFNWVLDAPVSGKQYCFGNYQARSGALTITSTTGVTIYYKGIAGTVTSGTLVSGGTLGDFICMIGTDSTTYQVTGAGYGTWTNN